VLAGEVADAPQLDVRRLGEVAKDRKVGGEARRVRMSSDEFQDDELREEGAGDDHGLRLCRGATFQLLAEGVGIH
jgi:hypothetical protein